ncbi:MULTISPECIES: amino acid permease [Mycobacteriaceae]|uniref:Amino acid permease n=1 Tax=Mycolicibacterium mucogenicum DSM 44124 TaxID=1226753 RepID=A0A8H2PFV1_MYCMU|nr:MULTISPECIES: amino acid permease [Mycobacteriaceae]KAB7758067.1 amino acid transporter [Mycolicibacterium mucogenicum DSM 44124]QPG71493.1 amino acid permease [Mycolicibacterium mucogenicum DSM 44124]SDZ93797.1 Amino acid transporter [Mycobacterium sp. 283mftsu]
MPEGHEALTEDELLLAKLGYSQELHRSWSGFSNFAISFSIISILSGCFTSFGLGWNNGGPAAIAWGWPIVATFILVIGLCMSELVSAFPTSGGIYWWAAKLGGAKAGFYAGWLNLIGLVAILASVAYGCATFIDLTLGTLSADWLAGYSLTRTFVIFVAILGISALINIFSSHLLAIINNVSVWWHVFGAAAVIGILIFVPSHHASFSDVFAKTINNSGMFGGATSGAGWLFVVLPISVILTQYTITGYDASAHLSEETKSAAGAAAKGIWRSIFYSAVGGWILLLAFLFAVQDSDAVSKGGGAVAAIFNQAMSSNWATAVLFISTAGQFFCAVACQTSASRMLFAFSRDRAVPGHRWWSEVNKHRVPTHSVTITAVVAAALTLPALVKVDINGTPTPVAFYAVVSIGVVGVYLCFAVPIYYRWRAGDEFATGSWNLRGHHKWMAPVALAEITITSIIAMFPTSLGGVPWDPSFEWKFVNYTPLLVGGVLFLLYIYWHVSVKNWFTGPIKQVEEPVEPTAPAEPVGEPG